MGKGSKDGLTDKNNIGGLYMDKINNFSHMKTYLYALRYLWPPNKPRLWFEFLLSLVFMIAASASDLYGPIPMQRIITVMSGTTPNSSEKESISFPTMDFIAFGLVTFSSGLFPNLRDLLFAAVSVETECSVCTETFHHLQQLSLSFHLRRETGGLLRAVSRGAGTNSSLIKSTIFILLPMFIKFVAITIIFAFLPISYAQSGSPNGETLIDVS
ncbi:unnamed protein product [Rotaria magnacalcarata]|uniref:ABC transmembrane type-1 domain-containing protein n=1 Tax=Rotaria magnacalcarata TaxID=392030 RepID=A0A820BPD3_9BILA|nr:unnamed protein product [Rotaria magnacalcarata]CAF4204598.1 unnamed protein product [Rotaria magnacalcarata]